MEATDMLTTVIEEAIERGIRKALAQNTGGPRMLSVTEAAVFIGSSKREITYMLQRGELNALKHGRRTLIDRQDLEAWIAEAKQRKEQRAELRIAGGSSRV